MTLPLVKFENVNVALDGHIILHRINWQLRPREHWAILGGNGSGKSTFLKLVRGELRHAPGSGGRRVYALDGEAQTSAVGIKEAMALVSPELQQRYLQQEWRLTGLQVVQSGFGGGDYVYQKLSSAQWRSAESAMELLGVAHLLGRNVQEVSTGELRRILLARALAPSPRVLICDEVCDGLDAAGRAGLLQALDRIARAGTQLLYTTHRAGELIPALTHRLVLEQGRVVEQGRIPKRRMRVRAVANASDSRRVGERRSAARAPGRGFPIEGNSERSEILIRVKDANVFLGLKRVLGDIDWELRRGEHWAIVGPNGAGKTTFLKLICGDLHPALGGRVRRFEFTKRNTIWEVKRRLGFVSPESQANYRDPVSGWEVIASGFFSSVGLSEKTTRRQRMRVDEIIVSLGLRALSRRTVGRMSYGEFRNLLLARALVHEPEILILDEPFDGLDARAKARMARIMETIASQGTSLIVVSHHAEDLPQCLTHTARFDAGRIVEQGPVVARDSTRLQRR